MTFWQLADASPQQWPMQRALSEPSSLALSELIQQICTIDSKRSEHVVKTVCHPSNWALFRDVGSIELQSTGLSEQETMKLLAAIEFGKRIFTSRAKENISDCESAALALQYELGFSSVEKFAVLVMDVKQNLVCKEIISVGSCDECIADPKVVFERVLRNKGSRFIIAHNHPSGEALPSPSDIKITRDFLKASRLMNVTMLDHLILAESDYCSIKHRRPDLWRKRER